MSDQTSVVHERLACATPACARPLCARPAWPEPSAASGLAQAADPHDPDHLAAPLDFVEDQPVLLGPQGALVGVVTRPASGQPTAPLGCLLLSFGAGNRTGPNRINVKIARALAGRGVASLRLDLSGLGESRAARSALNFLDQAVQDLQAGMDHLQQAHGLRRFAVVGLCSGAISGYALARADARVAGLLMFDGFSYPGRSARWWRAWERMRAEPLAWVADKAVRAARAVARRASAAIAAPAMPGTPPGATSGATPAAAPTSLYAASSVQPAAPEFARAMDELLRRGASVYLVYSGSLRASDRNRTQLGAFGRAPFVAQVRYEFMAEVDHAAMLMPAQRRLIGAICGWIDDIAPIPSR